MREIYGKSPHTTGGFSKPHWLLWFEPSLRRRGDNGRGGGEALGAFSSLSSGTGNSINTCPPTPCSKRGHTLSLFNSNHKRVTSSKVRLSLRAASFLHFKDLQRRHPAVLLYSSPSLVTYSLEGLPYSELNCILLQAPLTRISPPL